MPAVPETDVAGLAAMLRSAEPPALLDVREPWETDLCAIAGSILMPLGRLPQEFEALPQDRPLVVVCHHGMRSRQAVLWLRAQGYERAINLAGGIDAWARTVDPSMRVY